jgi:hypothetical protein
MENAFLLNFWKLEPHSFQINILKEGKCVLFNLCTLWFLYFVIWSLMMSCFLWCCWLDPFKCQQNMISPFLTKSYDTQHGVKMPWEARYMNNDDLWQQLFLSWLFITHNVNPEWNLHCLPIVKCYYQFSIINFCQI